MKYKINKGLITQKLDDKTVIFDGEESVLYTFNETATYIFKKIKQGKSEKEIVGSLARIYKVKVERAERDFKELINDLRKKKIISSIKSKK